MSLLGSTNNLLGDGKAYRRRAKEFAGRKRRELRVAARATLIALNDRSYSNAKPALTALLTDGSIRDLERHWIVNGFSVTIKDESVIDALAKIPGVKKLFRRRRRAGRTTTADATFAPQEPSASRPAPATLRHPWYSAYLQADRAWREFGTLGQGTLNVIHDFNFVLEGNTNASIYRNRREIPGNGKDDDGNGLIDDYHGYNFAAGSAQLQVAKGKGTRQLHGTLCAAVVCGTGSVKTPYEMGVAPRGKWAGVIAGGRIEAAIEWAADHHADTYSMSFSIPRLGEFRSHWRKMMEHGSLCGIYFVSGAGNFARRGGRNYAPVPVQMRTPEDIPAVVFAAAGVRRDLSRTPFSSQGPVAWQLEHYLDGRVQKPEVCAFNFRLPTVFPDGRTVDHGVSGNSFAGPMFCGAIALMLSADPDLLPWNLLAIIQSTALDVGPPGVDDQTGYGLINCYRAVKEVLRRRAIRDGQDATRYTGRSAGDELDVADHNRRIEQAAFHSLRK